MKINNKSHHNVGLIHSWVGESVKNIVDECFIMPDTHAGKEVPIGFVCKIEDKIIPEMVGVDIGCGMSYFTMPKVEIDFKELHEYILKYIPSGFKSHEYSPIRGYGKYDVQIGTLGGGNHFIEICEGKEDYYVIVHSGSRKYGHDICAKYTSLLNKKSKQERQKERQEKVNKIKHDLINRGREHEIGDVIKSMKKELGDKYYLTGDEFKNYMFEMREAQEFAEYNREEMLTRLKIYFKVRSLKREVIHVTHNYIDKHNVLRKGACSARKGEPVLIPINMKDGCIVGIGKGNEEWCNSAPHGAGRVLSRTQAKAQLSLEDFKNDMKGINTFCVDENRLDEAPRSYNSIDTILENIEETIEVVEVIKPIFNFKG